MRTLVVALGLVVATAAHCQERLSAPKKVVVAGVGNEPHQMTSACVDFSLTASQVVEYFRTAIVIDGFEEHDHYAWAPCWVRGTALVDEKPVTWEIRAGLTARVVFPGGKVILLADPSQRFSEKE